MFRTIVPDLADEVACTELLLLHILLMLFYLGVKVFQQFYPRFSLNMNCIIHSGVVRLMDKSAPQPNIRLKQERLLRGWSQVYVADSIDTDGYTVNRWERGRARPSPHFRQKLCILFGKNALDLGLLPPPTECPETVLTASNEMCPCAIPWSVPYPSNRCFTGRKQILDTLHTLLTISQPTALTQVVALSGLGGIGKTQIAIEYAYRYAPEYAAIFWIKAGAVEDIISSMRRIIDLLELPIEEQEKDQQRIIAAFQSWLATHSQWLLIWDSLEDLDLLQYLLQPTRQGAILITTRCQTLGTLAQGLVLEPMGCEEGLLFVLRRAKVLELEATPEHLYHLAEMRPSEYEAATELVTLMGGLPLALDQVGVYIDETGCSLANYLQLYQQQRMHLLNRRGILRQDHPQSVTATFLLAYKCVEQSQKVASDVLRVCTLVHAEAIPEELFVKGATHLGLEMIITDLAQFDLAIAVLRNQSLVQRHPATRTLSIHRLVQVVLQESMGAQERAEWMKRVTATLNAVFPEAISDNWQQCKRLIAHVLAIAAASADDRENKDLAEVLEKAANYLHLCGQYKQANTLYQRALCLREQALGPEHPEVTRILNSLACLSYE